MRDISIKLNFLSHKIRLSYVIFVLISTFVIMHSLDLGQTGPEYRVDIVPDIDQAGSVILVFYGSRYDEYVDRGKIHVPTVGWRVLRNADSTSLIGDNASGPIRITTFSEAVLFAFVQHVQGGAVTISDRAEFQRNLLLKSNVESIVPIEIGGPTSLVSSSGISARYGLPARFAVSILVFVSLFLIGWRISNVRISVRVSSSPARWECAICAIPLFLSTTLVLLAYYPGNVAYDGSLQWVQAATRGELSGPLGYSTTYLMRLFTLASNSPFFFLVLQGILASIGVALLLNELRYRRVPFCVVMVIVLLLALTPQYSIFFTTLGKDSLYAVGLLFFSWMLLKIFRVDQKRFCLANLILLGVFGLFSCLMRYNGMMTIPLVFFVVIYFLYRYHKDYRFIASGIVFLAILIGISGLMNESANFERLKYGKYNDVTTDLSKDLPLGIFSLWYIYHFFSAAVSMDVDIDPDFAELFYTIAPRPVWKTYDCYMTDTTMSAVSNQMLMTQSAYKDYLIKNQLSMAKAVAEVLFRHPEVLFERQACISKLLWYIGVGQRPFQATATLGYDSVDERFIALAGQSKSFVPKLNNYIQSYLSWSQSERMFWLFWKPALYFVTGFFIVGIYIIKHADRGVQSVAMLLFFSVLLLFIVMPFPAYRYAYPSVLLAMLTMPVLFAGRQPG